MLKILAFAGFSVAIATNASAATMQWDGIPLLPWVVGKCVIDGTHMGHLTEEKCAIQLRIYRRRLQQTTSRADCRGPERRTSFACPLD
jgi:hypothetical protein